MEVEIGKLEDLKLENWLDFLELNNQFSNF
jgi:hypothetical protein